MAKRPHILLFNPDQWRGDVMGHLGNPAAVTPNLDALVQGEAVSFRYAACQNPVCTPSRCSFMTGWYPHVRGHRTMFHMLHPERGEPNMLAVLKEAGYFVWWAGKNDLVPAQDGYERYCDVKYEAGEADYRRWGLTPRRGLHDWIDWRGEPGSDTYYSFFAGRLGDAENGGASSGGDSGGIYADGDWAGALGTIDFIRSAPRDRPLCLYLPLAYPHPPYGVEEPYFSMIDRGRLPARAPSPAMTPAAEGWRGKPAILRGIAERQNMRGWSEERWTELRATYYGMCARVDAQFGMILAALREAAFYDDTAAFFFSDHGDFTGDYGLVEKTQNTFEDCLVRVPLVVKPPRGVAVKAGVSETMAELVDVSATVYELAGIEPGYTHFGRSLLPVISGEKAEHREAVFCEGGRMEGEAHCMEAESGGQMTPEGLYWPRVGLQQRLPEHGKGIMCRTRDFKYVLRLYEGDELYDLARDPQEQRNVAGQAGYVAVLTRMRERTLRWLAETGDVVPWEADRRW